MKILIRLILTTVTLTVLPAHADECERLRRDMTKHSMQNRVDDGKSKLTKKELLEIDKLSTTAEIRDCVPLTNKRINKGRPLTLQQIEEIRSELLQPHNKHTLFGAAEIATTSKRLDCVAATSNFSSCNCLANKLPIVISYSSYVAIVTSSLQLTPENFGISQTDFMKLVGIVWAARDSCMRSN